MEDNLWLRHPDLRKVGGVPPGIDFIWSKEIFGGQVNRRPAAQMLEPDLQDLRDNIGSTSFAKPYFFLDFQNPYSSLMGDLPPALCRYCVLYPQLLIYDEYSCVSRARSN